MIGESIIAVGLLVDAVGAAGIVVPDLPPRCELKIRRITPRIRKYQEIIEKIDRVDSHKDINQEELLEEIQSISYSGWKPIRAHYEEKIRGIYTEGTISGFESVEFKISEDRGIVMDSKVRERPFNIGLQSLSNMMDKYINRLYRISGWIFLVAGFLIQFVGTLLLI